MTVTQAFNIRPFKPADLSRVVRINQVCLPENYPESFFLLIYSSFPEGFLVAESSDIDGYTDARRHGFKWGPSCIFAHKGKYIGAVISLDLI